MLDTVIIQIPIDYSVITDHSRFRPSTKRILENPEGFFRYVNNPKKEDKEKGTYKPKLTALKRGGIIFIKAEFSVPKLLFNNNLDEVEENDFDNVIRILQKRIEEMGVKIPTFLIKHAKVIGFHPSKNILLANGYTSTFAIREFAKINLNKKFDLEKVSFRNDGESLQLYTNSHSVVFYDKINDLNKPSKRAIDKDQTKQQLEIFNYIKKEKRNLEVLRFEVRLSKKKAMNRILEKIGYSSDPKFKDIFKKDSCQKILKLYWDDFFEKDLFLFSISNNPQKILQQILIRHPKTRINTAIFLTGLKLLCKDDEGIKGFRNIAQNYKPKTNWLTLRNYLKKFEDDIFKKPTHGFIKDIKKALDEFKPFKLK